MKSRGRADRKTRGAGVPGQTWSLAREARLEWIVAQEHERNERRGSELRFDRHGHIDEHVIERWKNNPCLCNHTSKEIRLFYHGDDFVTLADENDLQWFSKD